MLSLLLLLLAPIVSQRTIKVPIAVIADGDTLIIHPDSIASTDSGFFIKGIDWDVDSITFADDTLRLFQNGEEKAKAFIEASKDSSWVAIEVDDINSKSAAEINVKDDLIIDSTLTVEVVPFTYIVHARYGHYYIQCNPPVSGSWATHGASYKPLYVNQHNLDSIKFDSVRVSCNFWNDSVAVVGVYMHFYDISSDDDYSDLLFNFARPEDSLCVEPGGSYPEWQSKTFHISDDETDVLTAPFLQWNWSVYFKNWGSSTASVRVYSFVVSGVGYYTKK